MVKITNDTNIVDNTVIINPGDKFVQGIFQPYGVVYNNLAEGIRNGGLGSTDEQKS